jgi:hypothetical protein
MNHGKQYSKFVIWPMAMVLLVAVTGCSSDRDPILGIGTTEVALAPMVTLVAPLNNATGIALTNAAITATFNQAMAPLTAGTTFKVTTLAPGVNPTGTVALDATGRVATFTLTAGTSLAPLTLYTVTVNGATSLATGVALANPYVWSFTTGATADTTRPRVTSTVPLTTLPGPTLNVPANTAITALFTESMAPLTITAANFTVKAVAPGIDPAGVVTYVANAHTAVFTPSAPAGLVVGTTYTATLKQAITDLAGNGLAGNGAALPAASDYVWTFTTSAPVVTPPTLILASPANLATAVPINSAVNGTFSTAMNPSSIVFEVRPSGPPLGAILTGALVYDGLNNLATFTPGGPLTPSTTYTVTVTGAKDLTGNALAGGIVPNPWTFTTGTALAPGAINLNTAASFGIMATSAITSTGITVINGDVSLDPGTSMSGFPAGIVNGAIHINDTVSAKARIDLLASYNQAKGLPPGVTITAGADLGALYPLGIPPGTYTSGSTMLVSTPLVLDAGGNANAVWVFQIGSSFTTQASISLKNGAQSKNVFWVPTLDGTIGVGTVFFGTILAGRDVTGVTGAVINGRILAGATTAGTIALQGNTVNVPAS